MSDEPGQLRLTSVQLEGNRPRGSGFHHHIGGVDSPELAHDVGAVGFHCVDSGVEGFSNLSGDYAFGKKLDNLSLLSGQTEPAPLPGLALSVHKSH